MDLKITSEMCEALVEAKAREDEFWDRHNCANEKETRQTGLASPAWRAWVKAVEHEYSTCGATTRALIDTPMARKAFILGFNKALTTK